MGSPTGTHTLRGRIGVVVGPALLLVLLVLPPPAGLTLAGWRAAALGALMAVWWITEPVPLPATSLLPLVLVPALNIGSPVEAASPFANPVVFLFLGGFLLAAAVERWRLHERIAYNTAQLVGMDPRAVVGGFMLAAALLSTVVSNTASALVMLPMGLSIIALVPADDPRREQLAPALLLGIAYGASIGGLTTLIGTPPNALLAAFAADAYGIHLSFASWFVAVAPLALFGGLATWILLTRVVYRLGDDEIAGGRAMVARLLAAMGRPSRAERRVFVVFVLTAAAWMARPLVETQAPWLTDHGIVLVAALALFLLPSGEQRALLTWTEAKAVPWDVLVLFGGGLSLAATVQRTGLAEWLGAELAAVGGLPLPLIVLAVTALVLFLTELTSNTATAAALLPVVGALAIALGEPVLVLLLPAALAASCAFMLPVATPPNAVVYGTGAVSVPTMAHTGFWLNLTFLVLVTVHALVIAPLL